MRLLTFNISVLINSALTIDALITMEHLNLRRSILWDIIMEHLIFYHRVLFSIVVLLVASEIIST